ncbi:MAG: GTP 3',8-cyclase MoaA [Nitrospiraceae bacterium]|nr:MAG: GTP 3',8-cyclase MoaA [Nitrospiraceae bacterium]
MKDNNNNTQPLTDSFNRRIDYLRISITDKCNLKCIYCKPVKGLKHFNDSDILTNDEITRIVRVAFGHGLRKVRITGGEPLLRKDIFDLISAIKKVGIPELSLTTNGIKLSECAQALKLAGLDRVNISLDTLDPVRYKFMTRGGDIKQVWKAIETSEKVGLTPVKINAVPIRGINDDEIESFASLSLRNNYHIRFIEFMPASRNGIWSKDKCIPSTEILDRIAAVGPLEQFQFRGNGPSRNYRIKGAAGVIGVISPLSDHFCSFCNRLRLTANGKIRPCLFSSEEIDIRTPVRSGAGDEIIEELFLQAVRIKPRQHLLNQNISASHHIDTMSKIGG